MEAAIKRNASILCEVIGDGFTTDAYHLVKPDPTGEGAFRAMQAAIEKAIATGQLSPTKQNLVVNAHATSTPVGDSCEWNAIRKLKARYDWIDQVALFDQIFVTANKSNMGHCFGAAGAIESIFAIQSLKEV